MRCKEIAAFPVQKQDMPQKVTEKDKWEKGKIRIKKLLYEMTEDMPGVEILNTDSVRFSNGNKSDYYGISVQKRPQRISKERNIQKSRPNNSCAPLDLQELRDVALLAKNLRSRGHHRIRT
ncbi:MAG: hypothetical protein JW715_01660 [Sedimentisphaerales bacterium]|nr:hypothetical protein [Sedimentisphaerales bacterium]